MPPNQLTRILIAGWPWLLGLAIAVIALVWVISAVRSWLFDNSDTAASAGDLLEEYREMVRQGELSEEEFRFIKSRLGGRGPQAVPPAVRSDPPEAGSS